MTTTDTRPAPRCAVSGGGGSTDANFTDMRSTATRLDAAGDDATGLRTSVLRIAGSLPEKSALLSPGSAATVAGDIAGLTISLSTLALRMEFVARTLRWSAAVYELTDTVQRALLAAVNIWNAPIRLAAYTAKDALIAGLEGPFSLSALALDPVTSGKAFASRFAGQFEKDLAADPDLADGLMPWLGAVVWVGGTAAVTLGKGALPVTVPPGPQDFEGQIGWLLGMGRAFGYFGDSVPLTVTGRGKRKAPTARRQLSDLVGDATDVEHRSGKDHSVLSVRRVVGPDGKGSWIVSIPGTTHWPLRADHGPSDTAANLATMAGADSSLYPAIDKALAAAMKEAGVKPGSEPVMAVGHSQAGIIAARLAADKAFRTKYDVREVVTFGAPIDRIKIPKSVGVLSIENNHDVVPHADGKPTPDSYNRTDITCEAPKGEQLNGTLDAHDASRYTRSAGELSRDRPEGQLQDWYDRNDRYLDGSSTDYEFELRRP